MPIAPSLKKLLALTLAFISLSAIPQTAATPTVTLTPEQVSVCDPHKTCDHGLCDATTCNDTLRDRQQMMTQLHIASMRPGPGNHKDAPPPNFDESKANPYPHLPDPLLLNNGAKVTTAKMWVQQRRPQIVELFDREVYGRVPPHTPKVAWQVATTASETVGSYPVTTKQLIGHVDNSTYPLIPVNIRLTLTTPANAAGPVPIILKFSSSAAPPSSSRPGPAQPWQQEILSLIHI